MFFGHAAFIVGLIFLFFAFVFCLFDWKEIGLELFFTTQFSFYCLVVMGYFTPTMYGFSRAKYIMGYNNITAQQIPPYPSVPHMEHQGYSIGFQYNVNIMLIIPLICIIVYGIYRICLAVFLRQKRK